MSADESSYNQGKPGRKAAKTDRGRAQVPTLMNVEPVVSGAVSPAPVPERLGTTLSLMLVDDHAILREGLRALLELESDFNVVGEAASYDEAVIMAARLQPDVVLTDIGMPGRSGLALVRELRAVCPQVRVVLLTAHASEEYIRAGLDCSADGYVLKDSGHAELMTAIRTVATGQQFLCKAVAGRVLASYLNRDEKVAAESAERHHRAREAGADAHRLGPVEQGRGARTEPERQDRREASRQPDAQARAAQCGGHRPLRAQPSPDLDRRQGSERQRARSDAQLKTRHLLATLAVLAFALRSLVPVGFMWAAGDGHVTVVACSDYAADAVALATHHHHHHQGAVAGRQFRRVR